MSALTQTSTAKHGVIRVEEWPEGLVLWVGGEIAWKQWEHPRNVITLKLRGQHVSIVGYPGQTEEIAKRLVACWNAFDGYSLEQIESAAERLLR